MDGTPVDTWREDYPYDERMQRHHYDRDKRLLQIELRAYSRACSDLKTLARSGPAR